MEKYQPEGGYGDFSEEKLAITAVVRIDVEEMTGKEDLGEDGLKEAALTALKDNKALPVVLTRAQAAGHEKGGHKVAGMIRIGKV